MRCRTPVRASGHSLRGDFSTTTGGVAGIVSPVETEHDIGAAESYIASESVLFEETPPDTSHPPSWNHWRRIEEQLQASCQPDAFAPLEEPHRQALLDSFAAHSAPWYPFVTALQIHDAPALLQRALMLSGSLTRRIDTVEDLRLPYTLYIQAKESIYASSGRNPIILLMAITITACWSLRPPSVVSLDGPWHWAGLATRLALQLGLHRERTYSHLQSPNECRLIWYHLMDSDVLQAACWGRPCFIQTSFQDVELPPDSDKDSISLRVFKSVTRLLLVLRQVIEFKLVELPAILAALGDWHEAVAPSLRLHNAAGHRNQYTKQVNEMFIIYFAIIILVFFRHDMNASHSSPHQRTSVSPATIAASSCMTRLYEEIHQHEDSARLGSIHGFFLMLAAIPQIFHYTQVSEKDCLRERSLDLICAVLQNLQVKYGGCNMVLQKISKLRTEPRDFNSSQLQPVTMNEEGIPGTVPFPVSGVDQLFPFPTGFAPNLDLLHAWGSQNTAGQRDMLMDLLSFESSLVDWSGDVGLGVADFPQQLFM
ncbi:hypothetical protein ASPVEDRAFT_42914 [Aspergillus versicolor CBS 583.65]|uniref:Xylanolytic transcriptional activator regulatory domain-containing protein n=1 Tax=Aspergillus versicolor CBS 583.65 TaxID=1036611 RepID=A0A1L9PPI4_ASPVE|nr:uncharacterized protein ASPVEDRAFT_42914 [Aspergillus versicolor CBS 583.65]OJJ03444.1 hypothetical protein ASPVEDRAFT_42914 [Aspergillus versicolor CBS 583.65]